jgi:hypothetical protein
MKGIDHEMIAAQVTVGITYLEDHVGGSIDTIARHLDRLDVASLSNCPLGILFGDYHYGMEALDLGVHQVTELGFRSTFESVMAGLDEYPVLTHEWCLQVTEWVTAKAKDMVAAA